MIESGYQEKVARFVEAHGLELSVSDRLLDLVSEVGELAKERLRETDYGRRPEFTPGPEWRLELGDAFFSLICLANGTNVNLDDALDAVLDKYRRRLARTGDAGSGS